MYVWISGLYVKKKKIENEMKLSLKKKTQMDPLWVITFNMPVKIKAYVPGATKKWERCQTQSAHIYTVQD